MSKPIGVIGAGSFGTAMANMLAENNEVLLYARKAEVAEKIQRERISSGQKVSDRVTATHDLERIGRECDIIFPVIPSESFRQLMQQLSPYLQPYHIMIHGTKGLDINPMAHEIDEFPYSREHVKTMSEVIRDESVVVRIGCIAGPNLAREIADHQPAACVVASHFDEVIKKGKALLRTDRFQVYGSPDLIGVELSGVLKNIIAIASGALSGMGLGENARGLLISRGMVEMIYLGRVLGGNVKAFIGLAGVGDLVTTCSSRFSRNFTVGYRLAQGEELETILQSMDEVAEGVNTIKIARKLAQHYKVRAPITETLHKVLFEGQTVKESLQYLMKYPFNVDVDFL